jgi:hypothetical protein
MEEGKRIIRIGILIGAIIIGAGFYIGILLHRPGNDLLLVVYSALVFLAGGFFSGAYTSRKVWDGIWYGLLSGIIGAFLIVAYPSGLIIYSLLFVPGDESAGILLVFGIIVSFSAIVLAAAGGGIGVAVKQAFSRGSGENRESPPGLG